MNFNDFKNWSGVMGIYTNDDKTEITTEVGGVRFTSGLFSSEDEARQELYNSIQQYLELGL